MPQCHNSRFKSLLHDQCNSWEQRTTTALRLLAALLLAYYCYYVSMQCKEEGCNATHTIPRTQCRAYLCPLNTFLIALLSHFTLDHSGKGLLSRWHWKHIQPGTMGRCTEKWFWERMLHECTNNVHAEHSIGQTSNFEKVVREGWVRKEANDGN